MQIRMTIPLAFCLTLPLAAGADKPQAVSSADKQFMIMAAKADMTEANEGQLAENQAKRDEVKDFARMLVKDHTESYEGLTELAAKLGVTIPKGIDTGKDRTIQQLVHLKDAHFDVQFVRDEIASHKQALAAFKREAASGSDADVKAFAAKTIPVLEKHLQAAEAAAKPAMKKS
jgi:putative membrane protein